MELVLADVLAFQSEMTGAEDEVQVDMDALLRNCVAIRNRAVWSIASYGASESPRALSLATASMRHPFGGISSGSSAADKATKREGRWITYAGRPSCTGAGGIPDRT